MTLTIVGEKSGSSCRVEIEVLEYFRVTRPNRKYQGEKLLGINVVEAEGVWFLEDDEFAERLELVLDRVLGGENVKLRLLDGTAVMFLPFACYRPDPIAMQNFSNDRLPHPVDSAHMKLLSVFLEYMGKTQGNRPDLPPVKLPGSSRGFTKKLTMKEHIQGFERIMRQRGCNGIPKNYVQDFIENNPIHEIFFLDDLIVKFAGEPIGVNDRDFLQFVKEQGGEFHEQKFGNKTLVHIR